MKGNSNPTVIPKLAILLSILGFLGVVIASLGYSKPLANEIFLLSSFTLGASLFVFLFIDVEKNSVYENLFLLLLFSSAVIKVFAIHIVYGIYLGADASLEEIAIREILSSGFLNTTGRAAAILISPLSMIYVAITSMFTGYDPLKGMFNLIHLITGASIPLLIYVLIRNSFNTKIAILSSIVLAYSPPNIFLGLSMTRENFGIIFFLLSLVLLLGKIKSITYLFTLIFLLISLALSHYTTTYFALLVFLIILTSTILYQIKERDFKQSLKIVFPLSVLGFITYKVLRTSPAICLTLT